MDYKELISNAIEKDEVVKLLRGEGEYEVVVSEFTSDVFPTDVNSVLVNKSQCIISGTTDSYLILKLSSCLPHLSLLHFIIF